MCNLFMHVHTLCCASLSFGEVLLSCQSSAGWAVPSCRCFAAPSGIEARCPPLLNVEQLHLGSHQPCSSLMSAAGKMTCFPTKHVGDGPEIWGWLPPPCPQQTNHYTATIVTDSYVRTNPQFHSLTVAVSRCYEPRLLGFRATALALVLACASNRRGHSLVKRTILRQRLPSDLVRGQT